MDKHTYTILKNCGLFQAVPESQLPGLLNCLGAEEARFEKGSILWHAGDPVRSCVLILSGALRAEAINSAGEKSLVAHHAAGDLVGDVLMSTQGGVSPVYVAAAEDTTVLFLPFQTIMAGCERSCPQHAQIRKNLISEIAQKYWEQRRRIAYLSAKSLRQRIRMYLSDQAQRTGTRTFCLGCTREDLADLLGVNRSALSRELARMKAEGLLDYYRDTFRLLDDSILTRN